MNIFVTGGTGFIGQHLIRKLANEGHRVYFLYRDKNKTVFFEDINVVPVEGKLEEASSYQKVFNQGIDIVYHLAAIPGQKWGISKQEYYRFNVQATAELLKNCQGKIKRFIFCSSINAVSKDNKFTRDEYGKSKWQAEQIIHEYQEKGLKTVILRPSVVYGPGDTGGMMLKLCRFIKEKRFYMVGSGQNVVSLVYIDDVIEAFIKALDCQPSGGIYEIVGPDILSIKEITRQIAEILKVSQPKIAIPIWLARLAAFFSELFSWLLNLEPLVTQHRVDIITKNQSFDLVKAKEKLEYIPLVRFEEGIKKTIKWYQEHGYL